MFSILLRMWTRGGAGDVVLHRYRFNGCVHLFHSNMEKVVATQQERLRSALQYLADALVTGKYGRDDDVDEECFMEDFEELTEDIEGVFH